MGWLLPGHAPGDGAPPGRPRHLIFLSPSGYHLSYLSLKHASIPEQAAEEPVPSWCWFLIAGCCPARGRAPAPRAEGLPGPTTPRRWSAPSTVLRARCPRAPRRACGISAGRLHPYRASRVNFCLKRVSCVA